MSWSRGKASCLVLVVSAGLWAGCGGESNGSGSGTTAGLRWADGNCSVLRGQASWSGGCYLACSSSADCTGDATCTNVKYQPYCRVERCTADGDCGPKGWTCSYGSCYLACAQGTPARQSEECPTGFECNADPMYRTPWCTKIQRPWCGPCQTCYDDCASACGSYPQGCLGPCFQGCDSCCK